MRESLAVPGVKRLGIDAKLPNEARFIKAFPMLELKLLLDSPPVNPSGFTAGQENPEILLKNVTNRFIRIKNYEHELEANTEQLLRGAKKYNER